MNVSIDYERAAPLCSPPEKTQRQNQKKKKKSGFPIKDFGNDKKGGRHP